jgi:hypothetical protein
LLAKRARREREERKKERLPRVAGRHYQLAARDSLAQQSLCCLSPGRDTRDRAVGALVVPLSLSLGVKMQIRGKEEETALLNAGLFPLSKKKE